MENEKKEDLDTSQNKDQNPEQNGGQNEGQGGEQGSGGGEDLQAKVQELEEKNRQLYARVKKAEGKGDGSKKDANDTESIDEARLLKISKLAQDLDDEDFEVLEGIAGESIEEKMKNPAFKAWKEQKQAKAKDEAASMSPSTPGRATPSKENDPNEPGISKEEHQKRVKQLMG
jgi:hypothetical protein